MAAFTVVERGEMTFRFSSVRSALVWARVRAAGGLEDTTSFPPLPPTTCSPELEETTNERTSNKLRKAYNYLTTPLKGQWFPVLVEDDAGCTKLLIRCAGAVARCQGEEINCLALVLMSRSWGGRHVLRRCARAPSRLEFTTCSETIRITSHPCSLDFNTNA